MSLFFLIAASDSPLERWEEFSHSGGKKKLTEWMRICAFNIITKNKKQEGFDIAIPSPPEATGFFITLIKKGKVRGCFGAFNHSYGKAEEILGYYIKGALSLDPRHNPLDRYELEDTEIVLTVTSYPEAVSDINNVDISNFGLFIECGDSEKTVIVPAEYRTASRVIQLTGNRNCRYSRFRAVTIK